MWLDGSHRGKSAFAWFSQKNERTAALWATGYVNFKTGGGIFFSQIIAPRVSTSAKTSENIPQVILGSLKVGIWAP